MNGQVMNGQIISGYAINDIQHFTVAMIWILFSFVMGRYVGCLNKTAIHRSMAWAFVFTSVVFVERWLQDEPSGTRMLLIVLSLLWSMKALVTFESQAKLNWKQWTWFVVFWFGMRPQLFLGESRRYRLPWQKDLMHGLTRLAVGLCLILVARGLSLNRMAERTILTERSAQDLWPFDLQTIVLMIGLSLTVHFGLFRLLVAFWRANGVRCTALFQDPVRSVSLTEFWGRRWNLAFSEMTVLAVYRPILTQRILKVSNKRDLNAIRSPRQMLIAKWCAFAFSGLLHEIAISVPANSGYGGPMIYFLLHGIAMSLEGQLLLKVPARFRTAIGRLWTMAWVLIPLPLLFHRAFLEGCVWPLLN